VYDPVRLVFRLWWFVVSRKIITSLPDYKVTFSYNEKSFILYLRYPMDIGVLREIYIDKEYEWFPVEHPKVIVDLGAHYGDTALYYHLRYPQAKVIAVEPSLENYERLVKNVALIPTITPIQAAVGGFDGDVDLAVGGSTLGYSTIKNNGTEKMVSVPQLTLATLLKQQGINKADLIKFDIEGAEFNVFLAQNTHSLSRAYIGEVHTDLVLGSTVDSFLKRFEGMKIESTQVAGQGRYLVRIH
jgi:FkbM family methyltransferase